MKEEGDEELEQSVLQSVEGVAWKKGADKTDMAFRRGDACIKNMSPAVDGFRDKGDRVRTRRSKQKR